MDVLRCALCLTELDDQRLHVRSKFCYECAKAVSRLPSSELKSAFIDCSAGGMHRERVRNSKREYGRPWV